jgi:DNA-binding XRE family transcriptional regulator
LARSTIQHAESAQIVPTLDLLYAISEAFHLTQKEMVDFEISTNQS